MSAQQGEPVPACLEAIQQAGDRTTWRWARLFDLKTFEPCTYCFPTIDDVDGIDIDVNELIVTGSSGRKVHRHEDTGDISYDAAVNSRTDKDLNSLLHDDDFGPEDIGLSSGGDA